MSGLQPIQGSSPNDLAQLNKMIAQLNHEQQTKAFKGPGGYNALVDGRYMTDRYGTVVSDGTDRRILIGQAPDDGRVGIWVSKPGEDVITLLGG